MAVLYIFMSTLSQLALSFVATKCISKLRNNLHLLNNLGFMLKGIVYFLSFVEKLFLKSLIATPFFKFTYDLVQDDTVLL